jgi:restriction system protein
MLPLLKFYADGKEHTYQEAVGAVAHEFGLSDKERAEMLPSGTQPIFSNRVGWARTYLKKAGLIDSPKRAVNIITQRGLEVLRTNPNRINVKFLKQFPEFKAFHEAKRAKIPTVSINDGEDKTPEESLEIAYDKLRHDLATELLDKLKSCTPSFFERIVVEVIVKMGYGGSRQDAGKAIGRGGDGGIDGIIKEDKLGLDVIYIQAKRWENTVGRPEVQKFVGALTGVRAKKGLFITTAAFSADACKYATGLEAKVVLIDGETLADLMIDHNVGVLPITAFEIKKVNTDYFLEE